MKNGFFLLDNLNKICYIRIVKSLIKMLMKFNTLLQNTMFAAALTCIAVPSANAQQQRTLGQNAVKTTQVKKYTLPGTKTKLAPPARFTVINPSDYGEIKEIMYEDFSKFATGTEAEPDFDAELCWDWQSGTCDSPWTNVDPSYTKIPNWGGANLFPAGGKVFMLNSLLDGEGHINTPDFDFTNYDGVAIIEFKARTSNPKLNQKLIIESAETNYHGPEWRVLGGTATDYLTEEWKTYTAIFFEAGPTTLFNVIPQMDREWYEEKSEEPCQVLFDDFKVYSIKPYVSLPTGLKHSNYTGTEFDLQWNEQDADYYTVDIYAVDLKTGEMYEFKTGLKAETNSLHVTEAEPGIDYMFNVTAYKGDKKSLPSVSGFVVDIINPEFIGTPEFVKNEETGLYEYTSEWNDVPSAEVYDYALLQKRLSYYDGAFEILNTDFTGIQDAEGNTTEWTIENPSYMSYGFLPLKPLKQAGWVGESVLPFKDFVCLDGWQQIIAKNDAFIASPELDLSKDGGKIHLTMKLFGRIGGEWTDPVTDEYHPETQVNAAVSLYNYDEATGEFVQAEYVPIKDVTTAWNTFDVYLTKGSERSFICISVMEGPEHLYIDDLCITQNYKKGEYLIEPCIYEYWYEYSIIDLELPELSQGLELTEKVQAQKINPVTGTPVFSDYTYRSLGKVGEAPSGIQDAAIENAIVSYSDGKLIVNNARGELVRVATIDGKLVAESHDVVFSMSVENNTIYIVTVGNKSIKVTL